MAVSAFRHVDVVRATSCFKRSTNTGKEGDLRGLWLFVPVGLV